jgi:hypothetical protein
VKFCPEIIVFAFSDLTSLHGALCMQIRMQMRREMMMMMMMTTRMRTSMQKGSVNVSIF